MPRLYFVSVTIHVLAALLWLGGMFFLAAVGAPVLRKVEPGLRARLFQDLGVQFRKVGWIAILVLIATGILNLYFRGLFQGYLTSRGFWRSPYGHALAWKVGAVVAILGLSVVHDFVIGPLASRHPAESPEALRYRKWSAWIARLEVLVGIVLVAAAVRLARGG